MRITHLNAIFFPLVEQIYNLLIILMTCRTISPTDLKDMREGLTVRWVTPASFILEDRLRKINVTCFWWNMLLGFWYLIWIWDRSSRESRGKREDWYKWLVIFNTLAQQVLSAAGNALRQKFRQDEFRLAAEFCLLRLLLHTGCWERFIFQSFTSWAHSCWQILLPTKGHWNSRIWACRALEVTAWGEQRESHQGKISATKCLEKPARERVQSLKQRVGCKFTSGKSTGVNSPTELCSTWNC